MIKHLRPKFHKISYHKKVVLTFIFVSILPILVLQSIVFFKTTETKKKATDDLIEDNLVLASKNLNFALDSYIEALYQIYIDDQIIENLQLMNNGIKDDDALAFNIINSQLKNYVSARDGIRSIAIIPSNGDIAFYDRITVSSIESIWSRFEDLRKTKIYLAALQSNQMIFYPTEYVESRANRDYYLFHLAKKMYDFSQNNAEIGVAILSADENVIYNAINNANISEDMETSTSFNFLIDRDGNILSYPDKSFIGQNINSLVTDNLGLNEKVIRLIKKSDVPNWRKVTINSTLDQSTGWIIINVTDSSYLLSQFYQLQIWMILIGFFVLFLSIGMVVFFSRNLTRSINKILSAMKTAQEGELSVQIEIDQSDEVSIISTQFNSMMKRIRNLISEITNTNQKLKEAEIRALEAQINPHFLYNTLDSINWLAIEKDELEISQMLNSLAQILRYSINMSNQLVNVKEEVEWIKQYLYLQQNRFYHSFTYRLQIDKKTLDCKIHKLLLQPFIENALIHGFDGKRSGGIIIIRFKLLPCDILKISIEDNGVGMDQSTLSQFSEERISHNVSDGVGMMNVLTRIKIYYENPKWEILSSKGKGTKIILYIPVKR